LALSLVLIPILLATGNAGAAAVGPLGDAALRERVLSAPEPAGEEALVLFEGRYYTLDPAGRVTERVQRLLRINTEHALEQVGDPSIPFDSRRQELTVHAARSYAPDGSFVDSPANAFNDVTPRAVALSTDHLHLREMVVTHVGLEPGVTILLDYTLRDLEPPELPFGALIFPQGDWPILEMEIVATGGLRGATVNPIGGLHALPDAERDGDGLRWHLSDLPAQPGEARHRLGDQIPSLVISVADGWEELATELGDRVDVAARDREGLSDWLAGLEEDEPFLSAREKLTAWAGALNDRTTLLRYRSWQATAVPRPVSHVLASATATPMERCALLIACCQQVDLDAGLVLPTRWRSIDEEHPGLELLGSPLVWVAGPEDRSAGWWIDPNAGRFFGDRQISWLRLPALLVRKDGSKWLGPLAGQDRRPQAAIEIDTRLFWDLSAGTGKADGRLELGDLPWEGQTSPASYLADWVESWSDSSSVGETEIRSSSHSGLEFHLRADAAPPEEDERGRIQLSLPVPPLPLDEILPPGLDLRRSQMRARLFPQERASIHHNWAIRLPEGWELLDNGSDGADFPGASFTLLRVVEGDRIEVDYSLEWDGRPIEPADYPAYRTFLNKALDPAAMRIVLTKVEEEEED